MGQKCATTEKTNTEEITEEVEEGLFEEDETENVEDTISNKGTYDDMTEEEYIETETDNAVGGADFNLLESWDRFDEKNYIAAVELLGLSAEYLEGEGEDLTGKDAAHLEATIHHIEGLKLALGNDNDLNHAQISSMFSKIGLNLTKDYLSIAIAINESPEDNEYYVSKAISLLERIVPSLKDEEKDSLNTLLQSLVGYDEKISEGTLTEADNLQDLADKIQQILKGQKVNF